MRLVGADFGEVVATEFLAETEDTNAFDGSIVVEQEALGFLRLVGTSLIGFVLQFADFDDLDKRLHKALFSHFFRPRLLGP